LTLEEKGHGRITTHQVRVVDVEAQSIQMPFARAVLSITRTAQCTKPGSMPTTGTRTFITSLDPASTTALRFAQVVRSHWGIENKIHWKRDAQWGEDQPRLRSAPNAQFLAILRGALLTLLDAPCPELFAKHRRLPAQALRLITSPLKLK
jgi:predicted transposase YbfD/YdcC